MDQKPEETQQDATQTPPASQNAPTANPSTTETSESPVPSQPSTADTPSPENAQTSTPQASAGIPNSVTPPKTTSANTPSGKKSKTIYIVTAIILVILIAGGAYFFMTRHVSPQQSGKQQAMQSVPTQVMQKKSPAVTPVTAANVDQTLHNADTTMQQTINQANADLNSVSTINTSQDSTSGL